MTRPRWFDFPITTALAVAAIAATALWAPAWSAEASLIQTGQWWRLWTGPFVHATTGHLVRDVAVLVVVGVAYEAPLGRHFGGLVCALLCVPALAAFAAHPRLEMYCGLSGLTHGLIAAALVCELRGPEPVWYARWVALALVGKLAFEAVTGAPLFAMELGAGVRQVPVAHVAGAVVGAVWAYGLGREPRRMTSRRRRRPGGATTNPSPVRTAR